MKKHLLVAAALRSPPSGPRLSRCALAVALLAAGAAHAQDEGMGIRFSGFGTVGVAHSSEKNADFTSLGDQPSGAGATRSWSFDPDTRFGGQADVKFNDRLTATGQVSVRQRYNNTYNPEVMMAFGKWQVTPEVAVRLGRMPIPVFLTTDYRAVGYAQPQIRPPVDTYHLYYLHHIDGVDLTWSTNVGSVALKTQAYGGSVKLDLPGGAYANATPFFGANVTGDVGDMTLRASFAYASKVDLTVPGLQPVFAGVRNGFPANSLFPGSPAIPGSASLADRYDFMNMKASFLSVGFKYDNGLWFVTSELTRFSGFGISPVSIDGYVTGGMRFGDWTPYATVSAIATQIAGSTTGNPVVDALRESSAATAQKTFSLGLRWDVAKNVDIKSQFDLVRPNSGSSGQLTNIQPAYQPGKGYSIFSVAVDFVF